MPHKPLRITGKYVYWDAGRRRPIAWGFADGIFDKGPAVTIENWENASVRFGFSMIAKSPFAKK
jgi:hypothetical protein